MDLFRQIDAYCERTDPGFWAEPVNAATNASFLIAALVVWAMLGGKRDPEARVMAGFIVLIGLGSFLFHTFATVWASIADTIPILSFIIVYIFFATRRFFDQTIWVSGAVAICYVPFSFALAWGLEQVVGSLNGSVGYLPVVVLMGLYALLMVPRNGETARGLLIGAGLLGLSLVFRSIDNAICPAFPLGTHFMWHILNGVVLGWMILVLHGHETHSFQRFFR